jgi:hypothetical protein
MSQCNVRKQTVCDKTDKICNPQSGRCVKKTGRLGRKINIDLNLVNVQKLHEMATNMKAI